MFYLYKDREHQLVLLTYVGDSHTVCIKSDIWEAMGVTLKGKFCHLCHQVCEPKLMAVVLNLDTQNLGVNLPPLSNHEAEPFHCKMGTML